MLDTKALKKLYKKLNATNRKTLLAILYTNRSIKEVVELRTNEAPKELKRLLDSIGKTYLIETQSNKQHKASNFTKAIREAGTTTPKIKETANYLENEALFYNKAIDNIIDKVLKPDRTKNSYIYKEDIDDDDLEQARRDNQQILREAEDFLKLDENDLQYMDDQTRPLLEEELKYQRQQEQQATAEAIKYELKQEHQAKAKRLTRAQRKRLKAKKLHK